MDSLDSPNWKTHRRDQVRVVTGSTAAAFASRAPSVEPGPSTTSTDDAVRSKTLEALRSVPVIRVLVSGAARVNPDHVRSGLLRHGRPESAYEYDLIVVPEG